MFHWPAEAGNEQKTNPHSCHFHPRPDMRPSLQKQIFFFVYGLDASHLNVEDQ